MKSGYLAKILAKIPFPIYWLFTWFPYLDFNKNFWVFSINNKKFAIFEIKNYHIVKLLEKLSFCKKQNYTAIIKCLTVSDGSDLL